MNTLRDLYYYYNDGTTEVIVYDENTDDILYKFTFSTREELKIYFDYFCNVSKHSLHDFLDAELNSLGIVNDMLCIEFTY